MVPPSPPSAEERLAALRGSRRAFLTSVSHELRTPLTTVTGYVEMVLDLSATLAPDDRAHLRTALAAAHRLTDLIDTLVASHRIDLEGVLLRVEPVDLDACLGVVADLHRDRCARHGITLAFDHGHGGVRPLADPDALGWLLGELVTNATKFTPHGGTVTVSSRATQDAVLLAVADSGSGIVPGDREHVFERFYRAQPAVDGAVPGTGLGLSIARAIVDAHGGVIAADGRDPGPGTCLTVTLPLVPPDHQPPHH